jgi:hypothetical protein
VTAFCITTNTIYRHSLSRYSGFPEKSIITTIWGAVVAVFDVSTPPTWLNLETYSMGKNRAASFAIFGPREFGAVLVGNCRSLRVEQATTFTTLSTQLIPLGRREAAAQLYLLHYFPSRGGAIKRWW